MMGVKSLGIFLMLVGVAISEMSAGPLETAINQPAATDNVRIVGGKKAELGEFPHQLFMEFRNETTDTWGFICGAFILNSRWALTAAHCVYGFERKPELFTLHAGYLSRSKPITGREEAYEVIRIAVHPEYNNKTDRNDIALVRIEGSFEFSKPVVQPAEILMEPEELIGEKAIVSGWGVTDPSGDDSSPVSDYLRKTRVTILASEKCAKHYDPLDDKTQLCAGRLGHGSCGGDSGGPLEIKGSVVGIVSYGHEDNCFAYPAVYTRVSGFKKWIQKVTFSG